MALGAIPDNYYANCPALLMVRRMNLTKGVVQLSGAGQEATKKLAFGIMARPAALNA